MLYDFRIAVEFFMLFNRKSVPSQKLNSDCTKNYKIARSSANSCDLLVLRYCYCSLIHSFILIHFHSNHNRIYFILPFCSISLIARSIGVSMTCSSIYVPLPSIECFVPVTCCSASAPRTECACFKQLPN